MKFSAAPIGIFDSGLGGLTVFDKIAKELPSYDYLYLGDNARSPYGNLSFDTVYEYTLDGVKWLFDQGCELVILACNTASAKALRNIQQFYLPQFYPNRRVLGVIRPTAEVIGKFSTSQHIGVLGTKGTIESGSYQIEIETAFPDLHIYQQACPMWVPLIENNEHTQDGADYFVALYLGQLLQQSTQIDTILLACTHYPILLDKIKAYLSHRNKQKAKLQVAPGEIQVVAQGGIQVVAPGEIQVVAQGEIVAKSLKDYLQRHPEIEVKLGKQASRTFVTTGDLKNFNDQASVFLGQPIQAQKTKL